MGSDTNTSGKTEELQLDIKDSPAHIAEQDDVDVAAKLAATADGPLDPETARRLRRKIDLHLMPLMCILYLMTFADKISLGQSAVLGLLQGVRLTQNQFNWLGTIFYLSYLAFQYPQNLALQKFPVGKWMSINIFIWSIALLSHAACKSFGGLFAVRFILGLCEGAITPGFLIVTSMFYTREEQTRRVGYWFLMNGIAVIFLGFVAFGTLHTKTSKFMPWQWLMIITGLLTLVTSILFWFFFPDSPANARFLTPTERAQAVQRIKQNQTGVENKKWKRDQFIEAFTDPKTWMLAFFAALAYVPASERLITNQRQIIVSMFGFTPIQTTLIGCVDGVAEILWIWLAVTAATRLKFGRAYAGVFMFGIALIGAILLNTISLHKKVGLLFCYWLTIAAISPFTLALGWLASITAGHTKRTTVNAIVFVAYGIGNAAGPFMWKKVYQPRNRVPWIINAVVFGVCALVLLLIRAYLVWENKKRDEDFGEKSDYYDDVYLTHLDEKGNPVQKKVDRAFLDLTDIQNREFRYVL
ncbi:hypothetical protein AGABI1DRAFT_117893 [Agaricus bisporus var. burnettii JB137-S8]|uniref:Major facilitator superfamily (MFS) profile domain-containing protein n=1 Tax=Agaricus bisporus var. burnettii (strain JB137-S8 / ATCC MYA-4627 / FGSC 10392) TaxID=597362 RepID=K5XGK8_AGABU|nr:uncharacterized protein AGABI1DRAFT_117893 [Agaricus bisporus var. burnettii JB137-S8]EKM82407.1 hypothetical protein AGABI1DRAFT_117893 [Agaricus bisporus var. burnettii JB137-S8]